jgi:hypothetical protein
LITVTACAGDEPQGAPPPAAETSAPAGLTDGGPQDIVGEGASLEPGVYTYSPFEPRVTFELGDGWEGGHTDPEFFDVWRGDRVAVMFARPGFLFDASGERVDSEGMAPQEALRLLRTRGTSSSRAPSMVLDGGSVPSIVLSNDEQTALFGGPEGGFSADPAFRNRIAALGVDGALVLVIVSAKTPMELSDRVAVLETLGTVDFDG